MSSYSYKARDKRGKEVKGVMDALSREDIVTKLTKMGYITTFVKEISVNAQVESFFERFKKISSDDMIMFYIQLSNMINAGVNILTALEVLNSQIENKKFKEMVGDISRNVEAGDSFSNAVSKHPKVFNNLFVNMVRAGEASGKLDVVLARFTVFFEREREIKQKIREALFYPLMLLFAGIAVTIFIITSLIPQFAEIFLKIGIDMPLPTLILYKLGLFIQKFWYILVIGVIAGLVSLRFYIMTEKGRFKIDRLKLDLPVIGGLYRKSSISRFSRTLGTLIGSGVPVLKSLDITKDVISNRVLSDVIGEVRRSVEKGEKIGESLKISEEFPKDAVQMISVGEETGRLEGMLDKIADFYEIYVNYAVKKITTFIEPVLLVIMGSMVGFVMVSMFMPIFDMMKILRH